ncbi:MAG: hypothetical protein WCO19_02725 [Candidatus Saccharibacteria bacterium]
MKQTTEAKNDYSATESKTAIRIHFICRGNTFRSRMAEAIIRSQQLSNVTPSSSGINADEDQNGKIAYWGKTQLKRHKKLKYAAKKWRQTTQAMIDGSDIVVVVAPDIYASMKNKWHIPKQKLHVWNVHDLEETINAERMAMTEKNKAIVSERIYNQLDQLTNELLVTL